MLASRNLSIQDDAQSRPLLQPRYDLLQKKGQAIVLTSAEGIEQLRSYVLKSIVSRKGFFMFFTNTPHFDFPWPEPETTHNDSWYRLNFAGPSLSPPISFYFDPKHDGIRIHVWFLHQWCALKEVFQLHWTGDSLSISAVTTQRRN